jgi:hypothetical protein
MANKIQIRKFLESKRDEAIRKLNEESEKLQENAEDLFFEAYKDNFVRIKNEVVKLGVEYDNLAKTITNLELAKFSCRYSNPVSCFNDLCSKLSISSLKGNYIDVAEAEKIKEEYGQRVEETEKEYNHLIAVCQANNAADGIKILENLGFNTSEIEVKKETTTLITNIDAKKLFVWRSIIMNKRILNILNMCLKLKDKGHDVFFCYSPHVQSVEVRLFIGKWSDRSPEYKKEVCINEHDERYNEDGLIALERVLEFLLGGAFNEA